MTKYVTDTKTFIEKAKVIHSNYDYSKTIYENTLKNVEIICPIHGEFWQSPNAHLKGSGCPECGKLKSIKKRTKTTEQFIDEANTKHNNFYDYSDSKYVNSKTKVEIICPEHGKFKQTPNKHLNGQGCPKCRYIKSANSNTKTNNQFLIDARLIHGDKYDYSKVVYVNDVTKVKIRCPIHGEFEKTPNNHLNTLLRQGCPICGESQMRLDSRLGNDEFTKRAVDVHGDKYDYSKIEYKTSKDKVCIICPEHGEFWQTPSNHVFSKQRCPECFKEKSNVEREILEYIESIYDNKVIENDRCVLNGKEIDIYLPDDNIGFEVNGILWHSEQFGKDSKYHMGKTKLASSKGVKLIHIFEDEWIEKQEIVKSRISNILNKTEYRIYARKCEIKSVGNSEANQFLDENHLQGKTNALYKYGLYYDNELVSLMTLGNYRKSLGRVKRGNEFELIRFCNKLNTVVVGGASRLLKHFIKDVKPSKIISYSDNRWGIGNLYENLGFKFTRNTPPNYYYVVNRRRENRFKYRKDILVKDGWDSNMTEHEIMLFRGIYRIYDCGNRLYEKGF